MGSTYSDEVLRGDVDGDGTPGNIITEKEDTLRIGVNNTNPGVTVDIKQATGDAHVRIDAVDAAAGSEAIYSARVGGLTVGRLYTNGPSFSPSGAFKANVTALFGDKAGGVSIAATDSAGDVRIYSGGTADGNLRAEIDQDGISKLLGAYFKPAADEALYLQKALLLTGLTTSWGYLWEDFDRNPTDNAAQPGWSHFPAAGSASVINFVAGTTGGVSRMRTGATGSSRMDQMTNTFLTHQAGTARWYYACRMKLPTTTDAQTCSIQTIRAGTNVCAIGYNGRVTGGDGRFIAYYDGDFATAGTALDLAAVDTSWHIFEMWVAGDAILRARIDGGTTVVAGGAQASGAADAYIYHVCGNGTTAADKHMDRDWVLCVYGRSS